MRLSWERRPPYTQRKRVPSFLRLKEEEQSCTRAPTAPTALSASLSPCFPTTLCSSAGLLLASPCSSHHNGDQVHSTRPSSPWTRLREASSSAFSPKLLFPALGLPQSGYSTLTRHPEWAGGSAAPWAVAAGLWEKSILPGHLGSQF